MNKEKFNEHSSKNRNSKIYEERERKRSALRYGNYKSDSISSIEERIEKLNSRDAINRVSFINKERKTRKLESKKGSSFFLCHFASDDLSVLSGGNAEFRFF